jgi:hypothetical protein
MEHEGTAGENEGRTEASLVEALRAQLVEQERALESLQEQAAAWERAARDHEATIVHLREFAEKQLESIRWLEEQRALWENATKADERIIVELQAQVRRLEAFVERMTSTDPRPR